MAPWSTVTTPSRPDKEPWISELLPEPATPVTTTSTPSGMSTSTSCRLCDVAPRISSDAVALAHRLLDGRPVVEVLAGEGAALAESVDGALEDHLAAPRAGARAEVDHVVRDRDALGLVLDDQHGVALVAQLEQQVVHPLDVVGVQADGRLIEDIGDVGERGAEVPDHLGALRLAARQRAGGPVEGEVAEPDLHERVEQVQQAPDQWGDARVVDAADPLGGVGDLHRADVGDADALDLRGPGGLVETGAVAGRAGLEDRRSLHERLDVRLQRVDVLAEHRLADLGDQAFVGDVDLLDLDLPRLGVQEVLALLRQ